MLDDLLPLGDIETVTFIRRPVPIPPDLRFERKVALMAFLLRYNSYRNKASVLKLQLFNWAFSSSDHMIRLRRFILDDDEGYRPDILHLDPALNYAIDFALAEGLVKLDKSGKIELTAKGKLLAEEVRDDPKVLSAEKDELEGIGKKVSENKIRSLVEELF
jgi:hypothetical protein